MVKHVDIYSLFQDLGEDMEKYFHDVVAIVEERIMDGGSESGQYNARLQQLYDEIICSARTGRNIFFFIHHFGKTLIVFFAL